MSSATIEAPPTTETSMMNPIGVRGQQYMQEFFGGGDEADEYHPRTL